MATYDTLTLKRIYEKTNGRCHLTGARLELDRYGQVNRVGGWEVDHSVPRALGGSDHLNNLYAASVSANRAKQHRSSRAIRTAYGLTRAPLSSVAALRHREAAQVRTAVLGGAVGAAAGAGVGLAWAKAAPEHAGLKVAGCTVAGGLLGVLLARAFSG